MGLVYSQTQRSAAAYLPEYSQHYNTAEIDSWFYRIPDRSTADEYVRSVPPGFRWTCKAPQEITLTHHRTAGQNRQLEANPDFLSMDVLNRFLDAIEPILPTTDMVMFEFEYLNKSKLPGGFAQFIDLIGAFADDLPRGVPFGFEPRNANFLTGEWFSLLAKAGASHVFSQKMYLPNVWELYEANRTDIDSMPRAVFRLPGGDRQEMARKTGNTWNAVVESGDR